VPPLTDDQPRRLRPLYSGLPLRQPESLFGAPDAARASHAFATSTYIVGLWPEDLRLRTLAFFEHQRMINAVLREGPRVLRHIEYLHFSLTATSLQTLPLWALASYQTQVEIAETHNDGTGAAEYVLAKQAFATRRYEQAEQYLRTAASRGLTGPTLGPLRVYAFCLMGRLETARELAATLPPPADRDESVLLGLDGKDVQRRPGASSLNSRIATWYRLVSTTVP